MFVESKYDGDMVQQFVWDKVGRDYSYFAGIDHFTDQDLLTLQALCLSEYNKRQQEKNND